MNVSILDEVNKLNDLAQKFIMHGELDEAKRILYKALRLNPYAIRTLNNLAVVFFGSNKIRRALRYASLARKIDKKNIFTNSILGIILHRLGKPNAIKFVDYALRIAIKNKNVDKTHINSIFWGFSEIGDSKRIVYAYRILSKKHLDSKQLINVAIAMFNLGLYDECLAILNSLFGSDLTSLAEELKNIVQCAREMNIKIKLRFLTSQLHTITIDSDVYEVDAAIIIHAISAILGYPKEVYEIKFSVVLLLAVDKTEYLNLIKILLKKKELLDGIKKHIIDGLYYALNLGLIEPNDLDGTEVYFQKLGEIAKLRVHDEEDFEEATKLFRKGLKCAQNGDIECAERYYKMALERYPLPEAQLNYANILRRKGNLKKAEKLLVSLVESFSDYELAKLNLAGLYIQMRRFKEAYDILKQIKFEALETKEQKHLYIYTFSILASELDLWDEYIDFMKKLAIENPQLLKQYTQEISPNDQEAKTLDLILEVMRILKKSREAMYVRYSSIRLANNRRLKDLLSICYKDYLLKIGKTLGIEISQKMKKAKLVEHLSSYILENIDKIFSELSSKEKEVLRYLAKRQKVSYQTLKRRWGSDKRDFIHFDRLPETTIGKLRFKGLIFIGLDKTKKQVAVIPNEIRSLVAKKLR